MPASHTNRWALLSTRRGANLFEISFLGLLGIICLRESELEYGGSGESRTRRRSQVGRKEALESLSTKVTDLNP